MKEVNLAKSAGFCFGVKRAVDMVYEEVEKGIFPIYTYGPIIHNETVVSDLEKKGVKVIDSPDELEKAKDGIIIIRSHGVSEELYNKMLNNGLKVIDATCPFVKKIHNIVREHSAEGESIIIIGNKDHPEVEGIKGWACGETFVLENASEISKYSFNFEKKYCIVSQTTFNNNKFKDLVEIIRKKVYNNTVAVNTICNATELRQTEARTLASKSDAMIVIGGKHSSNTQKLFDICKTECEKTLFIQTIDDLKLDDFTSVRSVGITAGASTPNNIIEEVWQACQKKISQNC